MEKLKLKHLAPYLPYGLKINQYRDDLDINFQSELVSLSGDQLKVISERFPFTESLSYYEAKPILRPLSDLNNEIEESIIPIEYFEENYPTLDLHKQCELIIEDERWINHCDFILIQYLLEWHFDVFGLIEKGLAINMNEQ